jgi:hypothetical protein
MKLIYGLSPDIADSTVVLTEVALRVGINVYAGDHVSAKTVDTFAAEAHAVYDDVGDGFDEFEVI